MHLLRSQRGITLMELLIATAISALILGVVVSVTLQTIRVTSESSTQITALEDIKTVAIPITSDVRMAKQVTDPATGLPAADGVIMDSLILDWTSWYDDAGDLNPVDYHCEYAFLQSQGLVQRKYWENYDDVGPGEPTSTTTFGRYISDIEFSRHDVAGGSSYIQVVITSSPEDNAETAEHKTYYINMLPMTEVPETT